MAMAAVGADDIVIIIQCCTNTCAHGFLAHIQVQKAIELSLGKNRARFFFKLPDRHHTGIDVEQGFFCHCAIHTSLLHILVVI